MFDVALHISVSIEQCKEKDDRRCQSIGNLIYCDIMNANMEFRFFTLCFSAHTLRRFELLTLLYPLDKLRVQNKWNHISFLCRRIFSIAAFPVALFSRFLFILWIEFYWKKFSVCKFLGHSVRARRISFVRNELCHSSFSTFFQFRTQHDLNWRHRFKFFWEMFICKRIAKRDKTPREKKIWNEQRESIGKEELKNICIVCFFSLVIYSKSGGNRQSIHILSVDKSKHFNRKSESK